VSSDPLNAAAGAPAAETPEHRLERDVLEFVSLLGGTLRDLKRAAGPPPRELREAAVQATLGQRHIPALLAVAAAGPITVSDLARRLGLLLSSTSTIVGQLSRAGLLDRSEDDQDRRRTIVRLHAAYQAPMEEWLATALAPVRGTFEELSPEERAHFMRGWQLLHELAAEAAARAAEPDAR
jgi:DNA-binding MarR family transcriptional regulator